MTPDVQFPGSGPSAPLSLDLTEDQIRTTAGALQKTRPAYGPMIEFYSRIFSAQAATLAKINPDPIIIEDELLSLKKKNEMPLITPIQFRIDLKASKQLMKQICNLAVDHAPKLAKAGESLGQCLDTDTIDLDQLFNALLDGMNIDDIAKKGKINAEGLGFFGFSAIAPSIQTGAAQLSTYLKDTPTTNKAYCPICGSSPDLAFFDESGKKHVTCSLCSHAWQVQRMGCLFCDSMDKEAQHYFFTGEEKEYRVYCCDHCRRYIKTVDIRQLGRRFFPKLEKIATLHLDMKAKEQGYRNLDQDTNMS